MRPKKDKHENGGYLLRYFTQFPNIIDDSDLTPHEFRVLIHYYRVGSCWEGVRATAKKCKMSVGKVVDVRRTLKEKGFIIIKENPENDGSVTISVVDKAKQNIDKYDQSSPDDQGVHGMNTSVHPLSDPRSQDELKNTPLKNTPLRTSSVSSDDDNTQAADGTDNLKVKENTNTNSGVREVELDLQSRQAEFRDHVFVTGGLLYTSEMLDRFIRTYSQPNGSKRPKMRWEIDRTKKGWDTGDRLKLWATRNIDRIQCYISPDDQKTIQEKRQVFAKTIEAFKDRYTRDMLLDFYRWWGLPEATESPKKLRWELEEFWDLGTKLAEWHSRELKKQQRSRQRFN